MTKQARAVQTRSVIIRAAAAKFDRYGYNGTSLSDIIAETTVTKGALYFHFATKEDLATAVVQEQHGAWLAHAREFAGRPQPALQALIAMSFALATELVDDPVIRGGIRLTLENGAFQTPLPTLYLDWITIVAATLDRAVQEGDVRADLGLPGVARLIVASFTGTHLLSEVLHARGDLAARLAEMWQAFLPGLAQPRRLGAYLKFVGTFAPAAEVH